MPIGYYTDNSVSHTVMKVFSRIGLKVKHIREFTPDQPAVFYGILRGSGSAIRLMQHYKKDFWYVDNGYVDAVYMNQQKRKEMSGKYRIVKNGLIDTFNFKPTHTTPKHLRIMLMPPSTYTAFMHDTTPEDWTIEWTRKCDRAGHAASIREKGDHAPLATALKSYDAVLAFNSMGVIEAMKEGKAVFTTHGIIRNSDLLGQYSPYYNYKDVSNYFSEKQFTLEEIQQRGISCLT